MNKPAAKEPASRKAAVKKSALRQTTSAGSTAHETAEAAPVKKKAAAKKKPPTPASKGSTAFNGTARETAVAPNWKTVLEAAESKQAKDIRAIDLREVTTFTNTLVICSGANSKQLQAIADEVETRMKEIGERPMSVEGYSNAEWILLDYGDCVVNIFSDKARAYYDLERLWRDGKSMTAALCR